MENYDKQENRCGPKQRPFQTFSKIAAYGVMIVAFQHMPLSLLDCGHFQAHLYFPKPITSTSTPPEDPIKEALQTDSSPRSQPARAAWLKKAERFSHIIIKAAAEHEIDPALIKAIIMAESGYNPRAISKKGASGLMQLMPGTAESLGVKDIFDPEHNINGGVLYFKRLKDLFDGDVQLALAAYNAGARKVKMYQGIPPFKATRYYIKNVFKYYEHSRRQMTSEMNQLKSQVWD